MAKGVFVTQITDWVLIDHFPFMLFAHNLNRLTNGAHCAELNFRSKKCRVVMIPDLFVLSLLSFCTTICETRILKVKMQCKKGRI